jgi:pimeloyl-ACP methyl ester carboxylesterase
VPKAEINGLTVHYQQRGQGPDLVMIHGLFSNLAFWYLSVMPELARDFRVTVYDLRGHGYSDMPPHGYTSGDMAIDLHALLERLGIERTHIVGHSFGGAVALHHTAIHPERVLSLTMADARVPCLQPALPPRSARRWRVRHARLRQAGIEVPEDLPRVVYSFFEELARLPSWGEGKGFDLAGATALLGGWNGNSRAARRWFQLVRTTSAPADLADVSGLTVDRIRQVAQPTLAIFGQYSGCLTTLRGLEEHLPNCRRVIVHGVGHFHPVLKPETFVQKLRQFILCLEG